MSRGTPENAYELSNAGQNGPWVTGLHLVSPRLSTAQRKWGARTVGELVPSSLKLDSIEANGIVTSTRLHTAGATCPLAKPTAKPWGVIAKS